MTIKYFSLILSVAFLAVASPALADVVIGETCTQLGASQMTTDHKDIAVCLEEDGSTDLVWKGSTSGSTSAEGMICGFAYINPGYAGYNGAAFGGSGSQLSLPVVSIPDDTQFYRSGSYLQCQGQDILKQINKNFWQENCPDGYRMISIKTMVSPEYNKEYPSTIYQSPILTCIVE